MAAEIENSGFSLANGSGRACPSRQPGDGVVTPPVQAGMVPSLLPMRSAPTGVSVVLSLFASSGVTPARASVAARPAASARHANPNRRIKASLQSGETIMVRPITVQAKPHSMKLAAAAFRGLSFLSALCFSPSLLAADLADGEGWGLRWDNTLRYSAAARLAPRDARLVADGNADDGDRDFAPASSRAVSTSSRSSISTWARSGRG